MGTKLIPEPHDELRLFSIRKFVALKDKYLHNEVIEQPLDAKLNNFVSMNNIL